MYLLSSTKLLVDVPHEDTFQLQTDLPSFAALQSLNLFQSWGKTLTLYVWYLN